MSSYRQSDETKPMGLTIGLAAGEIGELAGEMADLCSTIHTQFPNKYEGIAKYKQAHSAYLALAHASVILGHSLPARTEAIPITVKVGRQTRHNRSSSQRVRLGNVVVRLRGVAKELQKNEHLSLFGLEETIEQLDAVTFPVRYG